MGWTTTYRRKGMTDLEFFTERTRPFTIHAIGRAGSTVYIAASAPSEPDRVFALIYLTQRFPKDPDYNFGYKDMCESMGPYERRCPQHVLDKLTPTDNEYALSWREDCRRHLESVKKLPPMRAGLKIRTEPINFGLPYGERTEFVCRVAKPLRFEALPAGKHLNIFVARIPRQLLQKRFIEVIR